MSDLIKALNVAGIKATNDGKISVNDVDKFLDKFKFGIDNSPALDKLFKKLTPVMNPRSMAEVLKNNDKIEDFESGTDLKPSSFVNAAMPGLKTIFNINGINRGDWLLGVLGRYFVVYNGNDYVVADAGTPKSKTIKRALPVAPGSQAERDIKEADRWFSEDLIEMLKKRTPKS